jgi:hypothetical protein
MMDFVGVRQLFEYYEATRGVGHTHILVKGIENATEPFFFMASNVHYAEQVIRESGQRRNGRVITPHSRDVDKMRGSRAPLIIDNSAAIAILAACINELRAAGRAVVKVEQDLNDAMSSLSTVIFENSELMVEREEQHSKIMSLHREIGKYALENILLEHRIEHFEEESALGFIKRKVKRWTTSRG